MRVWLGLLLALLAAAAPAGPSQAQGRLDLNSGEKLFDVPSRPGTTISFLALPGSQTPPVANVILFPGGNGVLGSMRRNFLMRTRDKFAALGLFVVSIGMASDYRDGLAPAMRIGSDHAEDVAAVIAWIRARNNSPVWLVGTSNGTISAASVAARLGRGGRGPDGLVLTSTISPPRNATSAPMQIGVEFAAITGPVLFVHNSEDGCEASLYANLQPLMARLRNAERKELLTFSGGDKPSSGPCEAMSRHGYLGLEDQVVAAIVAWIKAN